MELLSIFLVVGSVLLFSGVKGEIVHHTTEFFYKSIDPSFFNWTMAIGHEYEYHASLLRSPDLPNWIQYTYSKRHRAGFLYGVPPLNQNEFEVEIVALNRRTYETRRRVLHFNIQDKNNPATHEIHLKIDNINVDDLFDSYRLTKLLDIFRNKLWKESFLDLYVTFMTSAVNLGARLPLKPNESEGVVMRLGSSHPFSSNLIELQEEIKPLWKLHSCPRDYKRTTVERWFREEGFSLDWCSFKLISDTKSNAAPVENKEFLPLETEGEDIWKPVYRESMPRRTYSAEFAVTILLPMLIMIILVAILSMILCLQNEGMSKERCDISEDTNSQYVAVQYPSNSLRSLSKQRDSTPQPPLLNDDDVTRPNPPPYSGGTMRS